MGHISDTTFPMTKETGAPPKDMKITIRVVHIVEIVTNIVFCHVVDHRYCINLVSVAGRELL